MDKFFDLVNLFRKGDAVSNPEAWKDAANAASLLVPLLTAIVKVLGDFGYGLKLTPEQAVSIAGGVVAVVQFVISNISSAKSGILPAKLPPAAGTGQVKRDDAGPSSGPG